MGTFQSILARIRTRVIDLPAAVEGELIGLMNAAMKDLQDQHNFFVMRAETVPLVTVAGTRTIGSVPTDFKSFRNDPFAIMFNGSIRNLTVANDRTDVLRTYDDQRTGPPKIIVRGIMDIITGTSNFEVYPLSDSASDWPGGQYRITIPYWRYATPLQFFADHNWFTDNAEDFIVYKATALAFPVDWDEERAAVWTAMAEVERKKVVKADKYLWLSAGDPTLVPHWQGVRTDRTMR